MACDCTTPGIQVAYTPVFAPKSTSNTFLVLTDPVPAQNIARVLAELELLNTTSDVTITLGMQSSNDLETWSDTAIGTGKTSDGTYQESASSLTAALFYRFGVYVKNTSAATACDASFVRISLAFSAF